MIRKLLVWFTNTKFYHWLLISVIPYLRFTFYYANYKGREFNIAYKLLKKGDIILTKDKKKLTTLLIGGEWTHAALCVSKKNSDSYYSYEVAEMTHENYTKSDFFDLCKESDEVCILRCRDFDDDYIQLVVNKCMDFCYAEYDVNFDLGVKALYCSELVYQSDFEKRLKVNLDDLRGLGRKYISPTGLRHAENVEVIYDSTKRINTAN